MNYNKIIIALAIILIVVVVTGIVALNPLSQKTQSEVNITSANELNVGDNLTVSYNNQSFIPYTNYNNNMYFSK